MKRSKLFGFLLFMLIAIQTHAQLSQPINLKCEYLANPIGIDVSTPRLHWQMLDNRAGALQTAYQVIVGTDSVQVASGKGNCWDTGKISGANMLVSASEVALLLGL